jgi:hypothetical protein
MEGIGLIWSGRVQLWGSLVSTVLDRVLKVEIICYFFIRACYFNAFRSNLVWFQQLGLQDMYLTWSESNNLDCKIWEIFLVALLLMKYLLRPNCNATVLSI